jgi:hypothetical protein
MRRQGKFDQVFLEPPLLLPGKRSTELDGFEGFRHPLRALQPVELRQSVPDAMVNQVQPSLTRSREPDARIRLQTKLSPYSAACRLVRHVVPAGDAETVLQPDYTQRRT